MRKMERRLRFCMLREPRWVRLHDHDAMAQAATMSGEMQIWQLAQVDFNRDTARVLWEDE